MGMRRILFFAGCGIVSLGHAAPSAAATEDAIGWREVIAASKQAPSVKVAESVTRSSDAAVDLSYDGLYPDLNVTASYNPRSGSAVGALNATLSLYDRGVTFHTISLARSELRRSQLLEKDQLLRAKLEASTVFYDLIRIRDQLTLADEAIAVYEGLSSHLEKAARHLLTQKRVFQRIKNRGHILTREKTLARMAFSQRAIDLKLLTGLTVTPANVSTASILAGIKADSLGNRGELGDQAITRSNRLKAIDEQLSQISSQKWIAMSNGLPHLKVQSSVGQWRLFGPAPDPSTWSVQAVLEIPIPLFEGLLTYRPLSRTFVEKEAQIRIEQGRLREQLSRTVEQFRANILSNLELLRENRNLIRLLEEDYLRFRKEFTAGVFDVDGYSRSVQDFFEQKVVVRRLERAIEKDYVDLTSLTGDTLPGEGG